MSQQNDLSILDLDVGDGATIHTRVHKGVVLLATVEVHIMVLEADDGHLKLSVEQNTVTTDATAAAPMGYPSANLVVGGSDVER